MGEKDRSVVSVVRVSATTQEEAEQNTASSDQEGPQEDVDQSDDPEGKQVDGLMAVKVERDGGFVLHINRLIYPVDPHVSSYEPTEDKTGHKGVPGSATAMEDVGGAFLGLCTGKTRQQGQHQTEHPHHHQVDGDIVLPRALIQVHCANCYFCHRQDADNRLAAQ